MNRADSLRGVKTLIPITILELSTLTWWVEQWLVVDALPAVVMLSNMQFMQGIPLGNQADIWLTSNNLHYYQASGPLSNCWDA